jgi:glucose-6-phosphate-specific signal transduction histidine kinase
MVIVQKHAQASCVRFSAYQKGQAIVLNILNDGIGLEEKAVKPEYSFQNVVDRVQLLGGQFRLQAKTAQGIQIQITLPLQFSC